MGHVRRGSTLIEFTLVGIPLIFIITSAMMVALAMWQFENLEYGSQSTARFVAMHGRLCAQNGTSCTTTVDDVAKFFATQTMALDPSKTQLTLTAATAATVCNPLNTCNGNLAQFPDSAHNGINFDVTVAATYPVVNPLGIFWPGNSGLGAATINLYGQSRQRIVF